MRCPELLIPLCSPLISTLPGESCGRGAARLQMAAEAGGWAVSRAGAGPPTGTRGGVGSWGCHTDPTGLSWGDKP